VREKRAMETITISLLALAAFLLGAVPFSLLSGKRFLRVDIRAYGDGNPGATNVFRAGGRKAGYLAVALDIGKGMPFVLLAHYAFHLSGTALVVVAISAVLGHAFSPFLHWRGGKAVAVTGGVMLAIPEHQLLFLLIIFTVIGFLLIENDSWTMMFGLGAATAYAAITRGSAWETALMLSLFVILGVKHFESLHGVPGFHGRLLRWLQSLVHATLGVI
jgi:acyl phosphate:glycerol-3-phosphate acyltransferase